MTDGLFYFVSDLTISGLLRSPFLHLFVKVEIEVVFIRLYLQEHDDTQRLVFVWIGCVGPGLQFRKTFVLGESGHHIRECVAGSLLVVEAGA